MKKIILLMLFTTNFSLADEWIIGKWKLDVEATKSSYAEAGKLDEYMEMMLEFLGQGSIEFKDGEIITIVEKDGAEIPSSMVILRTSPDKVTIMETTLIGKERKRTFVQGESSRSMQEIFNNSEALPKTYMKEL